LAAQFQSRRWSTRQPPEALPPMRLLLDERPQRRPRGRRHRQRGQHRPLRLLARSSLENTCTAAAGSSVAGGRSAVAL
jgi:hypothetical protein